MPSETPEAPASDKEPSAAVATTTRPITTTTSTGPQSNTNTNIDSNAPTPLDLAISNLTCPSPPPILNNGPSRTNLSPTSLHPVVSPSSAQPGRETIKAGGAILNERERLAAGGDTIDQNHSIAQLAQSTPSPQIRSTGYVAGTLPHNDSVSSLDYTLNPPKNNTHHKVPSVHAHFYVNETLRPGKVINRSRSGSNSGSDQPHSSSTGKIGSGLLSNSNNNSTSNIYPEKNSNSGVGSSNSLTSFNAPATTGTNGTGTLGTNEQNANIDPRLPTDDGKIHVLLGVCGALSTLKIKLIIAKLFEIYTPQKLSIQLILTKSSENFISQEALTHLETVKKIRVWRDADEWSTWKTRSDPVLHIELRRWADILVVCPLTANTLSKIALGLCDNLLTNVIRAWNTSYPILLAPAMVSYSYNAITTKRQLRLISEEMPWIEVLKPVEKVVGSYGDIGMGGMMDWNEIVNKIVIKLGGYPDEEDDEEDDEEEKKKKKKDEEAIEDDDDDEEEEEEDDDEDDEDEDEEDEDDDDDDDAPGRDERDSIIANSQNIDEILTGNKVESKSESNLDAAEAGLDNLHLDKESNSQS
ncbi:flavoprotein [Scheffersomyces xylosifermentans]|uniref:flavoprotein n=1 Tax=Scheffersomyces xylosifermentans TaxID=1304137 RepID=UPI00315D731C